MDESDGFTFFVSGISHLSDEDLRFYFSQYGSILRIRIMTDKTTGLSKGYGFITLQDDKHRDQIFRNKHVIDELTVEVGECATAGNSKLDTRKLLISGLTPDITEDHIWTYFSSFGNNTVTICTDLSGNSRGFGYVRFETDKVSNAAIKAGPHMINGMSVQLQNATPELKRQLESGITTHQSPPSAKRVKAEPIVTSSGNVIPPPPPPAQDEEINKSTGVAPGLMPVPDGSTEEDPFDKIDIGYGRPTVMTAPVTEQQVDTAPDPLGYGRPVHFNPTRPQPQMNLQATMQQQQIMAMQLQLRQMQGNPQMQMMQQGQGGMMQQQIPGQPGMNPGMTNMQNNGGTPMMQGQMGGMNPMQQMGMPMMGMQQQGGMQQMGMQQQGGMQQMGMPQVSPNADLGYGRPSSGF